MKVIKALTLSLGHQDKPVITRYQLGLIIYNLYSVKEYKGEPIALKKEVAESQDVTKYQNKLLEEGVLSPVRGLPNTVFTLLGNTRWEPGDVMCTIDPFCYISHLSAMAFHGLTDRIPSTLFISSPGAKEWSAFAEEKMKKDLKEHYDEYVSGGLPRLQRIKVNKIGKVGVHCFTSRHLGAFKSISDREIRVSTMGRTFLDMLRNPELCGGINHVLEVFEEYAEKYLRLITDEINTHGKQIDKVRAGYILDERLGIKNETIESWVQFAQRGGSRKLDASEEYAPVWSDKWLLSINIVE